MNQSKYVKVDCLTYYQLFTMYVNETVSLTVVFNADKCNRLSFFYTEERNIITLGTHNFPANNWILHKLRVIFNKISTNFFRLQAKISIILKTIARQLSCKKIKSFQEVRRNTVQTENVTDVRPDRLQKKGKFLDKKYIILLKN